jgi:glucose/mannose transport system substrate-binding protein
MVVRIRQSCFFIALVFLICLPQPNSQAAEVDPTLQVLHWWTSPRERKAATVLANRLMEEGVAWKDVGVPGGAGIGAGKVLKSRVLASDAPEVTQIIGASIRDWADLGFLLELDKVANTNKWKTVFFPTIQALIQHRQHVVAAPLGIHRINTLFYNRKLFASLKLAPPESWNDLVNVAAKLKAAGIKPLAQSSEPWQVATLFENLILAENGPAFHREVFARQNPQAVLDRRFFVALERLRFIKSWMILPIEERPWTDVVRQFANREAAMMIMGDWSKAELTEAGFEIDQEFSCATMPGTGRFHLYSVDTFSMFTKDYAHVAAQEKLARLIGTPQIQSEYNAIKGSVSVRQDADPNKMDSCARASWTDFAQGAAMQAPSLAHRMATDESSRDAIIAVIHRFFIDDALSPTETQKRLAALFRTLNMNIRKS